MTSAVTSVLRADPGEYGDNAWDWSYITRLQIKRGPFSAQQFSVFNRVPEISGRAKHRRPRTG